MLIYISKKYKVTYNHFFNIFDVKSKKTRITLLILLVFLIIAIFFPAPSSYLDAIKEKYSLRSVDSLYDYTIPLFAAFIIFYTFYEDYKGKLYELLLFYNSDAFNYIMFYRWFFNVSLFSLGSFITGLFYFRYTSFFDLTAILLSLRFLPNILFLCSLILFVTVLTKNSYAGLFVTLSYTLGDFLSSARIFKYLSLGAHSNNFYYVTSPSYYLFNRLIIILLSIVFLFISCRKSAKG